VVIIPLQAKLIAGALGLALAFGGGWSVRGWKADADIAKIERKLEEAREKQRQQADSAADAYEQSRLAVDTQSQTTQTIIREHYRNVEVPASCALPEPVADSLRASVEAANRAASGEPAPALP